MAFLILIAVISRNALVVAGLAVVTRLALLASLPVCRPPPSRDHLSANDMGPGPGASSVGETMMALQAGMVKRSGLVVLCGRGAWACEAVWRGS